MANARERSQIRLLGVAGRKRSDITLLAVTKKFPAAVIQEAYDLGLREFGENYVQEFERKRTELPGCAALTPLDPIRMLFWSAVVNGIVAVPLMIAMMVVVSSRKVMGKFVASSALKIFGICATALMVLVVAAMLITSVRG